MQTGCVEPTGAERSGLEPATGAVVIEIATPSGERQVPITRAPVAQLTREVSRDVRITPCESPLFRARAIDHLPHASTHERATSP
jgi:hypothetical protein